MATSNSSTAIRDKILASLARDSALSRTSDWQISLRLLETIIPSGADSDSMFKAGLRLGWGVAVGVLDINKKDDYLDAIISVSEGISDDVYLSEKEIGTIKRGYRYGLNNREKPTHT